MGNSTVQHTTGDGAGLYRAVFEVTILGNGSSVAGGAAVDPLDLFNSWGTEAEADAKVAAYQAMTLKPCFVPPETELVAFAEVGLETRDGLGYLNVTYEYVEDQVSAYRHLRSVGVGLLIGGLLIFAFSLVMILLARKNARRRDGRPGGILGGSRREGYGKF